MNTSRPQPKRRIDVTKNGDSFTIWIGATPHRLTADDAFTLYQKLGGTIGLVGDTPNQKAGKR